MVLAPFNNIVFAQFSAGAGQIRMEIRQVPVASAVYLDEIISTQRSFNAAMEAYKNAAPGVAKDTAYEHLIYWTLNKYEW